MSSAEEAYERMTAAGFSSRYRLSGAAVPVPLGDVATRILEPARDRALVLATAAGDRAACEELVEAFLPAIAGVARRYRTVFGVQRSELLQEGVVGLLRAVRRFDPALETPFWPYASWWVRQAMQDLVSEMARPIVLSDRAHRALARVRESRRAYIQEHGREPSIAELADASELGREQVESILAAEHPPRMLGEPIEVDDWTAGTLEEQIADPVSEDDYERVLARLATEQVDALTDALDDRERSILYEHYGVGGSPQTLREIGGRLGLSAERVRQIEEQALDKLRVAASSSPPPRDVPLDRSTVRPSAGTDVSSRLAERHAS
ncbi:MAG TPA: sigma-70 family RNA polymerase sigma factor [Gaiellaceae bacterium]|nr:sigma-70 family RNA polymerase sigma factor [Gaiellaceae bacterium]